MWLNINRLEQLNWNLHPFCTIQKCQTNLKKKQKPNLPTEPCNYPRRNPGANIGKYLYFYLIFILIFFKYLQLPEDPCSIGLSHTRDRRTIKSRTYSRVREGIFSLSRLDFILASQQFTTARNHRGVSPPASRHSSLRRLTKNNLFNGLSFTRYFRGFCGGFPWGKVWFRGRGKNGAVSGSAVKASLRGAPERVFHKNEGATGHR